MINLYQSHVWIRSLRGSRVYFNKNASIHIQNIPLYESGGELATESRIAKNIRIQVTMNRDVLEATAL